MTYKIHHLIENSKKLREFLSELAAKQDEVSMFSLGYVIKKMEIESIEEVLNDFSNDLLSSMDIIRFIDGSIYEQLTEVIESSKIHDAIAYLRIQIDVSKRQSTISPLLRYLRPILRLEFLRKYKDHMFNDIIFNVNDQRVSIDSILVALTRLQSLLKRAWDIDFERKRSDNEIFKPSNINLILICEHIESAIEAVTDADAINTDEKNRLIEYLKEAKAELSSDTPKWKKVVGALIIVSTILSGIAAAPKAIENANLAIKHILGTAIERQIPNMLPPSEHKNKQINDELSDEETIIT